MPKRRQVGTDASFDGSHTALTQSDADLSANTAVMGHVRESGVDGDQEGKASFTQVTSI